MRDKNDRVKYTRRARLRAHSSRGWRRKMYFACGSVNIHQYLLRLRRIIANYTALHSHYWIKMLATILNRSTNLWLEPSQKCSETSQMDSWNQKKMTERIIKASYNQVEQTLFYEVWIRTSSWPNAPMSPPRGWTKSLDSKETMVLNRLERERRKLKSTCSTSYPLFPSLWNVPIKSVT